MAAPYSTAGAVIQLLASLGTGVARIYRDQAPAGPDPTKTQRPYITVSERSPLTPGPLEDGGPGTAVESVHVDVWQDWKGGDGSLVEDPGIVAKIERGVHGAGMPAAARVLGSVPGGAGVIYRTKLSSSIRMKDPTVENLVHQAMVVAVWRQF